jgi:nucleotide-binding universal stress UspA family protein
VTTEPILICYDGSDEAVSAIHAAAALLVGRKAVVVDIGPLLTPAESYLAIAPNVDPMLIEQRHLDDALERARAGADVAREAGFDAAPRADLTEPTWEGIVSAAEAIDAAVIVVGSRGLNGAQELLRGSVSHQLAEHAGRPVLVVTRPQG